MIINIKHNTPRGTSYDCYINNVKVRKNKQIDLPNSGTILLVEENILDVRFWWLWIPFNLIIMFGSIVEDFKDVNPIQKKIPIKYENIVSDELNIEVLDKGETVVLNGVEKYQVGRKYEEFNPSIVKRRRIIRGITIAIPLTLLLVIFIVLAITLIR